MVRRKCEVRIDPMVDLLPLSGDEKKWLSRAVRYYCLNPAELEAAARRLEAEYPQQRLLHSQAGGDVKAAANRVEAKAASATSEPSICPPSGDQQLDGFLSRDERLERAIIDAAEQDILAAPDPVAHAERIVLLSLLGLYPDPAGRLTPLGEFGAWVWKSEGHPFKGLLYPEEGWDPPHYVAGRETAVFDTFRNDGLLVIQPWMQCRIQLLLRKLPKALRMLQVNRPRARAIQSVGTPNVRPVETADDLESARSSPGEPSRYSFRRKGEMWEIRFGDEHGYFPDHRGFDIIFRLLRFPNPHKPMTLADLRGGDSAADAADQCFQPTLDSEALDNYREQIWLCEREIEAAQRSGDFPKVESLKRERQEVMQVIGDAMGVGGKVRSLGPAGAKKSAQNAARQAFKRACDQISKRMPKLAEHLRATIAIAQDCVYRPSTPMVWQLD